MPIRDRPLTSSSCARTSTRAGIVGSLVASDFKSTMLIVPLLDKASVTGKPLNYHDFSQRIEALRSQIEFAGAPSGGGGRDGPVQDPGDRLCQAGRRSHRRPHPGDPLLRPGGGDFAPHHLPLHPLRAQHLLVVGCSLVFAVIWQLGIIAWLGYAIDPYSVLVPFLIFAIGVSHAAQKMNGIMQDIARGTHRQIAARYTFRTSSSPGSRRCWPMRWASPMLMLIDIPVIQDLAITASIGVAVLIFTSLLLMPVALSMWGWAARRPSERSR